MRGRRRWCDDSLLGAGSWLMPPYYYESRRVRCEGKSRCGCQVAYMLDNGVAAYAVLDEVVIMWLGYCVIAGS
jgi:hypothetical protein